MNIKILLVFPLSFFPILGFSQNQQISDWQKVNQNVILIESRDFTPAFEEQLIALKQDFIVYTDEISMNDINRFESKSNEKTTANLLKNDGGNQIIKDWLGQNPNVKIISRTDFENASTEKQNSLINSDALILIGDKLTTTDIENYETTH